MPSSVWTMKSLVLFLNAGRRKKRNLDERKTAKSLLRRNRKDENVGNEIVLTDEIWSMICDYSSPLDVLRMRRVNQQLNRVVSSRLQSLIYFDVLRGEVSEIFEETSENDFHRVGKNRNFYVQIDDRSVVLLVDERWTSRDINLIWQSIQFFAPYTRSLNIDCTLAELCLAGLSTVKLSRWFAFVAYVNAIGTAGSELHMKVKTQHLKSPLFPKLTELTIRAMPGDMNNLSRFSDYGLTTDALFSSDVIQLVRCMLLEPGRFGSIERVVPRTRSKRPHQHLRAFKEWINSVELAEKYVQCYA
ncbi:F-box domain-containing protein [Aphelenchoides besseyi]|nr:F-box domain-containing protein [Aphelenchoides besseyi]KAI6236870.1 F-box domain-containing protein [Aphelenchoides besseyi]